MELLQILEIWLTPISVLISAFSLLLGIYIYRRQTNVQIFITYTQRYEAIMDSFPEEARFYRLNSDIEPPAESKELTTAVLKYLNLCAEEFYLRKTKQLSNKLWNIWKDELDKTLKSKLVRREWVKLKNEFSCYKEFQTYVDNLCK